MRIMLLTGLLLFVGAGLVQSGIFPFTVHEMQLENGLTILAVPMDTPGIVSYYTVVRTGSRNEPEEGRTGFAHFFEHMMFRGTDTYPEQEYNRILKTMGADSNAFTSDDQTVYHITGPSGSLETLFSIESDRFQNLKYPVEEFQKEAGAVLGEYRKSKTNPVMVLFEELHGAAYTTHTYRHITMGFYEDILNMPNLYEHSIDFFRRYYRPENCVLILTGDANPETVFEYSRKYYGSWARGYNPRPIMEEPPQKTEKRVHIDWDLPTKPYILMGYHVPSFDPENRTIASLDIISELLFASNAPLYQELVVEKQLVERIHGWYGSQRDPGLYYVMAVVRDRGQMPTVEKTITTALENLKTERIKGKTVKAVKSHLTYAFAMDLTTPSGTADSLSLFVSLTGNWKSLDSYYETLDSVSVRDIQETAGTCFKNDARTVITLASREES